MALSIAPLPFSIDESEKTRPVISSGQTKAFLNFFQQSMANIKTQQKTAVPAHGSLPQMEQFIASPMLPPVIQPSIKTVDNKGMREIFRIVFQHEGNKYVARDGVESSRFGILQSTAGHYGYKGDVRHMSQQDAEAIYKKLWDESGSDKLPADLALVHFDTFINSPAAARKMLKQCNGDTDTYLDMRSKRYTKIAGRRPERYARYMNGWMNRIDNLRSMVALNGTDNKTKSSAKTLS